MDYEWDEAKNASNKFKHGIGFEEIHDFDWNFATALESQTFEGEVRQIWIGPIGTDIMTMIGTERQDNFRIISLRRASRHERNIWKDEIYG